MSRMNRGWWAVASIVLLSFHGSSNAQTGAGGGGGGTGAGGGTSIGGGGGGTSMAGGATGNTFSGGFTLGMSGTTARTGAGTSSAVNQSNFLAPSYANPQFQGRAGAAANQAPGGFGQPLFTNTGTGNRTGQTGQTGQGGTAIISTNTAGGTGNRTTQRNTGGNTGVSISYGAVPKFRSRIVPSTEVQSNLRNILNRSTSLSNPGGIDIVLENGVFIMRGRVTSEDEARLAENMLRLSPGVRELRNELVVAEK